MSRSIMLAALWVIIPTGLAAQTPALPEAPPDTLASACTAEGFRDFDFWVGRWSVAPPGQEPRAVNHITREVQGCLIRENYWNAGGYVGSSTNWYTPADGLWRQHWIDNGGLILQLSGGLDAEGRMVLAGRRSTADGGSVLDRITWYASDPDTVHQIWDSSSDGGETWTRTFHGVYPEAWIGSDPCKTARSATRNQQPCRSAVILCRRRP